MCSLSSYTIPETGTSISSRSLPCLTSSIKAWARWQSLRSAVLTVLRARVLDNNGSMNLSIISSITMMVTPAFGGYREWIQEAHSMVETLQSARVFNHATIYQLALSRRLLDSCVDSRSSYPSCCRSKPANNFSASSPSGTLCMPNHGTSRLCSHNRRKRTYLNLFWIWVTVIL